jgi:hypothetical protein
MRVRVKRRVVDMEFDDVGGGGRIDPPRRAAQLRVLASQLTWGILTTVLRIKID